MTTNLEQRRRDLLDQVTALVAQRWPEPEQALVQQFVANYFGRVADEDLLARTPTNLYGLALSHWLLLRRSATGAARIRVYNPDPEQHGWQSNHTAIQAVTDDMPFLVDSLTMACNRLGLAVHLAIHPALCTTRDAAGAVTALQDFGTPTDACLHFEVDRQEDAAVLQQIQDELQEVLDEVRVAVGDWPAMQAQVEAVAAELATAPVSREERDEVQAFLHWLLDDHFTLLGYRAYDLIETAEGPGLRMVPDSGLGILRSDAGAELSASFSALPEEIRAMARRPEPLILTKSNQRARIHRAGYMDYIGVRRFDASGQVLGEHRILGLYGTAIHYGDPRAIPVIRGKLAAVQERAGLPPTSHGGRALVGILDSYPRDELFQIDADTLYRFALGILHLRDRHGVRLFVRPDPFQRYVSCLVFVPRDSYNTEVRKRMEAALKEAYGTEQCEFGVNLSEALLARVHFTLRMAEHKIPAVDESTLERRLARAARSWVDDLGDALHEHCGEAQGNRLHARYRDGFSAAYREDTPVGAAVHDIERLERLGPGRDLALVLYRPLEADPDELRLRLYHRGGPVTLSAALPVLENLGVEVLEERPYQLLRLSDGDGQRWIHDFGLRYPPADRDLDLEPIRDLFEQAFSAVWRGLAESDAFNQLVLASRLTWREVVALRAYCRYLRQAGTLFSLDYMAQTLVRNARIARLLVRLFHTRFDPERAEARRAARIAEQLELALNEVPSLDEDRMLRRILAAILATVRTNFYRRDATGEPPGHLGLKLLPAQIPDQPKPLPAIEIYLYSPRVEGVHLRAGKVARGGLRWSERREDYRTEVLGLMKAQVIKNAVIVPTGAKGGFVVRQPPTDWTALRTEAEDCYRTFVRGLLELTDNYQGTVLVPPVDVVRHDDDDPYLVVAADKGTAAFSDLANAVAAEFDFWLRDAFASGGSRGYDHKRMGITARGAWEAVKRHFRELGRDPLQESFTVVGIGDLSGDVFGNGVLLAPQMKLLAAFDHRHIFLDPDPDPATAFAERQRLFALPRSSWDDYDRDCLSPGGGVFARTAKSVPISPQVQRALAIEADTLTPAALIQRLLCAPLDLLWNGGIGVFVKATTETHAEVGDRGNDSIRVDATELRCRVVGEGGNLGLSQRARVEYALAGGRINTDAVDNAGGVDCSDHEVNIKILLDAALEEGELTSRQRDELLAAMTDAVAGQVLRNCYRQTGALSLMAAQAPRLLGEHARQIRALERTGRIVRDLDGLPDDAQLGARAAAGLGLTRPELAVLLAHAKLALDAELVDAELAEDPGVEPLLERYFPQPLAERFPAQLRRHRLRRAILCKEMANETLNRMGAGFAFRLADTEGISAATAVAAYFAIRDSYGLETLWNAIDALDGLVSSNCQLAMELAILQLAETAIGWLVQSREDAGFGLVVPALAEQVQALDAALDSLLPAAAREALAARAQALTDDGVPASLAGRIARLPALGASLAIATVATAVGSPLMRIAALYFELATAVRFGQLQNAITDYAPRDVLEERCRARLREQASRHLAALAVAVARTDQPALTAAEQVARWLGGQPAALARLEATLAELPTTGAGLTALTVAVQDLGQLARRENPALPTPAAAPEAHSANAG